MTEQPADWERWYLDQKEVYRQILDAIADMVLVKGAQSRILWANKAFRDYYGMSNEQLRDIIDAPFNEVDNTLQYVRDDLHVYTTGQVLNIPEEPVTRHDSTVNIFHTVKSPLRDPDGRVRMTVGVSRNITEQKRIKEDLARYREHLERLVSERTEELRGLSDWLQIVLTSLIEGIVATDADGRVQLLNPAAESLTGWTNAEARGRELAEILPFEHEAPQQSAGMEEWARAASQVSSEVRRLTGHLRSRSGARHLVAMSAAPLVGADGAARGSVWVVREIALEREVEQQRLRNQKLESVGLLAGGIAHDFNNLLTGILGSISIARHRLAAGEDVLGVLESAESACVRAQGLTHQLLTFSKGGTPVKRVLHVAGFVREAAELALHGSSVRLELRCDPEVCPVEADESQLAQAINNLVLNAKQAMPDGGQVTIAISNVKLSASDGLPLPSGAYVLISVTDVGTGISPEHLTRVFDPYFTTKEGGSGLGLASVHSIIRRHGGHVTVSSAPAGGARFSVYLPAAPCGPEASVAAAPRPIETDRRLRLLVLDDDPIVRDVMDEMLPLLGHSAVIVGTSAEALATFQTALGSGQPFDAVFVDLTMPGDLGGEAVIARLRQRDPAVKVVVMSGYSTSPVMAGARQLGLLGALEKPFTVEAVRELLARC